MDNTPASRAASASATALLAFITSLAFLVVHTTGPDEVRPIVVILCSTAMAISGVLHLVFVALLAQRSGRQPVWYVVGALVTLPVGSAVALVLYEWFTKADRPHPSVSAA